jgi:hypothetical protein
MLWPDHQRFVHSMQLQVDDLMLRCILTREGLNKLSPRWKGPFQVTQVCQPGSIRLVVRMEHNYQIHGT